jgi:hypothetical protein
VKESDIPFVTNGNIASGYLVLGEKTKYLSADTTKKYSGKALLVKTASAGRRGGKFVFGFATIDMPAWAADNDVIIVRGSGEDLELVHGVLKNQKTLEFIDAIVNNAHISMGLLKSIPLFGV